MGSLWSLDEAKSITIWPELNKFRKQIEFDLLFLLTSLAKTGILFGAAFDKFIFQKLANLKKSLTLIRSHDNIK
jgi:hypothetical protein